MICPKCKRCGKVLKGDDLIRYNQGYPANCEKCIIKRSKEDHW